MGCVVPPAFHGQYDYPEEIVRYQKKEFIGHTDPEQRMKDLVACGLPENVEKPMFKLRASMQGETNVEPELRYYNLNECMLRKGYLYISDIACGQKVRKFGICK